VNEVLVQAAGEDEALRLLLSESEAQRRRGADLVVEDVARKGRLRHSRRRSVDLLWHLTAPEHLLRLVRDSGWSQRSFVLWLADTMCEELLSGDPLAGLTGLSNAATRAGGTGEWPELSITMCARWSGRRVRSGDGLSLRARDEVHLIAGKQLDDIAHIVREDDT